jgi:plastocyanin
LRRSRIAWLAVVGLAALALVAAACGGNNGGEETAPTAVPTEGPAASAQTLDIAMVPSIRFDKDTLTVKSGATVTINVTNQDEGTPHSFSVYTDSSATQPLAEGSVGDVCTGPCSYSLTFVAPEPGVYFFRCDVHPTQMNGTFIVE